MARIVIDLPDAGHKAIKLAALEMDLSIKDYVLMSISGGVLPEPLETGPIQEMRAVTEKDLVEVEKIPFDLEPGEATVTAEDYGLTPEQIKEYLNPDPIDVPEIEYKDAGRKLGSVNPAMADVLNMKPKYPKGGK